MNIQITSLCWIQVHCNVWVKGMNVGMKKRDRMMPGAASSKLRKMDVVRME